MIDYGNPSINEAFFQKNAVHEISAPRLLYSNLLMPELAIEVSKISNQLINRGKDEAFLIEKTDLSLCPFVHRFVNTVMYLPTQD